MSWKGPLALAVALASLLAATPDAWARTTYTNHIPNGGEFGCDICHLEEPWLDPFGVDVGLTIPLGSVEWALVWALDSDGDGQSNGFELGDPCGQWARNGDDPERGNDLADPSDPSDVVPDDVPVPDCGSVGDDDDSSATDDDDDDSGAPTPVEQCGYSLAGRGAGGWGAGLALAILVGLLGLRRAR